MGVGSAKRAASKADRTPVKNHRSTSKAIKSDGSPIRTPQSSSKRGSVKSSGYSSRLPTDKERRSNGRVPGRNLIVWGRPRMAEKLLLHIQYECFRHKIQIPWDAIAHRLHPGSSGAAAMQHLNRLRRELIAEGHLVPPLPARPGPGDDFDPEIRGYVRQDMEGNDKENVRPVTFEEPMDDRKMALPDSYIDDEELFYETPARDCASQEREEFCESPTPVGRSKRAMNSGDQQMDIAPHSDFESKTLHPHLSSEFGDKQSSPDESPNLPDIDKNMYTSPQSERGRFDSDKQGLGIYQNLIGGQMQSPLTQTQNPAGAPSQCSSFAAYGADLFGMPDPHPNLEGGMPMLRSPFPFYHAIPYGFSPWPMGYPSPSAFCQMPGTDSKEKSDSHSSGHSVAHTKVEASSVETTASSESQCSEVQPSETQMDGLINIEDSEIWESIDPSTIAKA